MTDSQYVDQLLATKSDRTEIKAIQRHVTWLRTIVAAKGVGSMCPDIRTLTIRRSSDPRRNAVWIGASKVVVRIAGQSAYLDLEVPDFVQVLRDEVLRGHEVEEVAGDRR
jgi:hypothetical protein